MSCERHDITKVNHRLSLLENIRKPPSARSFPPNGFRLVRSRVLERNGRLTDRRCLMCRRCYGRIEVRDAGAADRDADAELQAAAADHQCPEPFCEWQAWERAAVAEGMASELASLGRQVIELQRRGKWRDAGEGEHMIEYGIRAPEASKHRWEMLLRAMRERSSGAR